jgi:hypothetical protein
MKINTTSLKWLCSLTFLVLFFTADLSAQTSGSTDNKEVKKNSPIWHDLLTPNLERSMTFYKNMFNWSYELHNSKGFKYAIVKNNNNIIGGMIEANSLKSSVWVSSLLVSPEFMKQKIVAIKNNKGELMIDPIKIPGYGKQLIFKGPQNETFSLKVSTANQIDTNRDRKAKTDGDWLGIELWSSDAPSASSFYARVFNVTVEKEEYDNKPYWFFVKQGEKVASMMNNPSQSSPDQWVPYVYVQDITKSSNAVNSHGGDLIVSPNASLRNGTLSIVQDPFGAIFCLQTKNLKQQL